MHEEDTNLKAKDFEEVEAIVTGGNFGPFLFGAMVIAAIIICKVFI